MEFSNEAIKILDYIGQKVGIIIDWSTQNVMPYVSNALGKFITYNILSNVFKIFIMILVGVAIYTIQKVGARKGWWTKEGRWGGKEATDERTIFVTASVLIGLIATIIAIVSINEILKLTVAPEIWLAEYISVNLI